MKKESIFFNGIEFRRYPESKSWADSHYFVPGGQYRQKGVGRLHQEIWKHHYGEIPDGHQIHHKDGNTLNNNIENLECIHKKDHLKLHAEEQSKNEELLKWKREHADKIRPLASAWHRSEKAVGFHQKLGKMVWENKETIKKKCEQCGKEYEIKTIGKSNFCSNNCKSAWRRASGLDNEKRTCNMCGKEFEANKYSTKKTCSNECMYKGRAIARKQNKMKK